MIGKVHVLPQAEYEAWLSRGNPGETLAQSGGRIFRALGCSGCHVGQGTVRAPPLEGLYGKLVPLENREFVRVDEAYLRDSILLPLAHVRAGYQPLMPTYQGRISEEELFQLIAYLKSLGSSFPEVQK
jgi:cytochrome c oxidase subunit 2